MRKIEKGDRVRIVDGNWSLAWPNGDLREVPVHWSGAKLQREGPWTVVEKGFKLPTAHTVD